MRQTSDNLSAISWPNIYFGPINLWNVPKMGDNDIFSKTIFENTEKGFQYRLTVSEFREVQYLHLRKYFMTYEGEYMPSKEGASIPASIQNIFAMLDGLIEICSEEESVDVITEYFSNKITQLKSKN